MPVLTMSYNNYNDYNDNNDYRPSHLDLDLD